MKCRDDLCDFLVEFSIAKIVMRNNKHWKGWKDDKFRPKDFDITDFKNLCKKEVRVILRNGSKYKPDQEKVKKYLKMAGEGVKRLD